MSLFLRSSLLVIFAPMLLWLAGCAEPPPDQIQGAPGFSAEYAAQLRDKGYELAERELARMAAAELIYRNTLEFHSTPGGIQGAGAGVYVKIYRNFTGFEVADVYRSESYLYPIAMELIFFYDLMATTPWSTIDDADAEELASAERHFDLLGAYDLTRRYRCDQYGIYAGGLPDLPPRPNFFERDASKSPEPRSAPINRLPPGGPPFPTNLPLPPQMRSLPPISGQSF